MKSQWILPIIISLVLAVVAAKFADNWITNRLTAAAPTDTNLLPVVAAATDIPAGTKVEAVNIKIVSLPPEAKPAGSYADPNELIGQIAKQSVYNGEIIVSQRFANSPGASPLAAIIPEGKRAITVAVNDVVGVSGFILPGSRVVGAGGGPGWNHGDGAGSRSGQRRGRGYNLVPRRRRELVAALLHRGPPVLHRPGNTQSRGRAGQHRAVGL